VSEPLRIRWAPPVPAHKLAKLYEANAIGLLDDELLDDVGWRLWERLSDVIRVSSGRVRCPGCQTEFNVRTPDRDIDTDTPCPAGDWSITYRDWHKTWQHRDLNGHCPEFDRFVERWPKLRSARDRMVQIDAVVHALHVSSREGAFGNFAARNFLEGSRPKIVALLEELAHGPGSAIATGARERWEAARSNYRGQHGGRR
jgi:hypothetical protein